MEDRSILSPIMVVLNYDCERWNLLGGKIGWEVNYFAIVQSLLDVDQQCILEVGF